MVNQPDVRGEGGDGAEDNQVDQASPYLCGYHSELKVVKFAGQKGGEEKLETAIDHLGRGGHGLGVGLREAAGENGGDGPGAGGEEEGEDAARIGRRFAERERALDENDDAENANGQCGGEAKRQFLSAQVDDLEKGHEDGDSGQNHRSDARGNSALGPEEAAVVEEENESAEDGD